MKKEQANNLIKNVILSASSMEYLWNELLKNLNISWASFKIITAIFELSNSWINVTPSIICEKCWWTLANISQRLNILEKNWLVKREYASKTDKRNIVVKITKKWEEVYQKWWEDEAWFLDYIENIFSEEEYEIFVKLLEKFSKTTKDFLK